MNIDIWSDIRCPFCYIGKKNLEKALKSFPQKDEVKVTWHSFQLDPTLTTQPEISAVEHFSRTKQVSPSDAAAMFENLNKTGEAAGITFNLKDQKVANSYRAHLLLQLAGSKGRANDAEEALFRAQLCDGKNIDDEQTLLEIGTELGFAQDEIKNALQSDELAAAISRDQLLAQQMNVRGVPFFVINDKYGVSGAQPVEVFSEVLEKSWQEFSAGDKGLHILHEGESCDTDGNCD